MDVGRVAGSWVSGSQWRWSCEADHVVAALEMVAPVTDARLVGSGPWWKRTPLLIVNVSNIVACGFQDATMSLRQILVYLDLHAPTCRRSGVKSSSPARSAA
jgi:hypothetical protein